VRADVRVIVGGAPVTPDYAESIGADGYAPDASRAVALTKSIIG
jgi:5-methyltetrahydrofolate--homocysteine methyltransferase